MSGRSRGGAGEPRAKTSPMVYANRVSEIGVDEDQALTKLVADR